MIIKEVTKFVYFAPNSYEKKIKIKLYFFKYLLFLLQYTKIIVYVSDYQLVRALQFCNNCATIA